MVMVAKTRRVMRTRRVLRSMKGKAKSKAKGQNGGDAMQFNDDAWRYAEEDGYYNHNDEGDSVYTKENETADNKNNGHYGNNATAKDQSDKHKIDNAGNANAAGSCEAFDHLTLLQTQLEEWLAEGMRACANAVAVKRFVMQKCKERITADVLARRKE